MRLVAPLFLTILLGLLLFSCSEEQDFDQAQDLTIRPVLASSIFYLESTEELVNQTRAGLFLTQNFTFEAFAEAFIGDRVLEGSITYEIENTTSKPMALEIAFLDETGNVLDVEFFNVQPEPTPVIERPVAYGPGDKSLDILRATRNVRVNIANLGNTTSVSSQQEPKIILRSSAAFRLRLR